MNDVRAATLDDASDIAAVQVAGWQAAYAGLMPAAVLAAQTVENRAPRWHSILSATVPEKRHAVFERAGRIVGFASRARRATPMPRARASSGRSMRTLPRGAPASGAA